MSLKFPRRCMSTAGTRRSATSPAMPGSNVNPLTSLTMSAPASRAARATEALVVSTESGPAPRPRRPRMTGTTRRHSSAAPTAAEPPGRVDSPPTSTTSAPASKRARPWSTAAAASANRPPSEKESGVTFSTPMTQVRSPRTAWLPRKRMGYSRRTGGAACPEGRSCNRGSIVAPLPKLRGARGAASRGVPVPLRRGLRCHGREDPAVPLAVDLAFPRSGGGGDDGPGDPDVHGPALQDLRQLLRVQDLVLEQGLRDADERIAPLVERLLRPRVLLAHDPLDLGVDLEGGGLAVVLVAVELL